jgi:hypothetical protein
MLLLFLLLCIGKVGARCHWATPAKILPDDLVVGRNFGLDDSGNYHSAIVFNWTLADVNYVYRLEFFKPATLLNPFIGNLVRPENQDTTPILEKTRPPLQNSDSNLHSENVYEVTVGAIPLCVGGITLGKESRVFARATYVIQLFARYTFDHRFKSGEFNSEFNNADAVSTSRGWQTPGTIVYHPDVEYYRHVRSVRWLEHQTIYITTTVHFENRNNSHCYPSPLFMLTNESGHVPAPCRVVANINMHRAFREHVHHLVHPRVMEGLSVSYGMSQYFLRDHAINSSRSFPDTFNVSGRSIVDGNDLRYDVCEARHCSLVRGNCTDMSVSAFGANQTFNATVDDIFAQCTFHPFHSSTTESPYIYVRAWFKFDVGTPVDPSNWRSGPYNKEFVGNHTPVSVLRGLLS